MPPKVTSCELAQSAQVDGLVAVLEQVSERIELRRHNRLSRSLVSSETFLQVRDGVLALEAVPAGGRRQILDFLMPGDAIPASVGVTSPGFFLRALTEATLERRSSAATDGTSQFTLEATTLLGEVWSHLMRRNLHQIMIGQLDTLSRVSSFLLMLALRRCRTLSANLLLPLPMSRDDVADYLAMNPDTLSRIMVRLEALRIIRRLNRHSVELIDDKKLAQLSPIRPLLFTTLGSSTPGEAPRNCAPTVSGAPFPPSPTSAVGCGGAPCRT
jgi:CRP/FNR family transcriptional regulator, anaerobic regulatory protein